MPTADASNTLVAKCLPRIVQGVERCGGATVVTDLVQTTVEDLESIYMSGGKYRVDHVLTETDFIGKAVEVPQNGMYDWLAATRRKWNRSMQGSRITREGRLEYEPFIRARVDDPINNEFWQATYQSGPSSGNYVFHATSATGIPSHAGFFPPGLRVFLSSVNKVNGTKVDCQMEVVSATVSSGKVVLTIKEAQAGSVAPSATRGVPGVGNVLKQAVLYRGQPNVDDYEEYCPQLPALATGRHAYYWVGRDRYALCKSELTQAYMKRLWDGNPYYKEFFHVDDVAYNRQVIADYQRRAVNQFWWGKASSANQTASDWDNLPTVTLDSEGLNMPWHGKVVSRKADVVGVYEQLQECGQIWDLQRAALPLGELFQRLYEMRRIRKGNGAESNVIELGMDSLYLTQFQTAMLRYFNARSEGLLRVNMELSKQLKQGPFGFQYMDFQLDWPSGLVVRAVTHEYFDDLVDAHRFSYSNSGTNYDMANSASAIWLIDWANVYESIIETNKQVNSSGSIEELARLNFGSSSYANGFGCRLKVPKEQMELRSTARAVVVDKPKSSLGIINFDRCQVPDHTAAGCGTSFMVNWEPEFPAEP